MALPPRTNNEDGQTAETVVGPAIAIRGRIEGQEDLRVEGRVEGSISLTETLYVEPGGVVLAQIEARDVVISGIVIGDISAANSVTLNKVAKLVGNIAAPRIIIADGASFRGDVVMGGEDFPAARERTRAVTTAPRAAGGGSSSRSSTPARGRTASGSTETRVTPPRREPQVAAPARPATSASTSAAPLRRPAATSTAAVASPSAPSRRPGEEDDDTVVIKHAALRKGEAPPEEEDDANPRRRRAKKSARMPVRGRSKVTRRQGG